MGVLDHLERFLERVVEECTFEDPVVADQERFVDVVGCWDRSSYEHDRLDVRESLRHEIPSLEFVEQVGDWDLVVGVAELSRRRLLIR